MGRGAEAVSLVELLDERRHLLDVAQSVVGSPGLAEHVVQETYRYWYGLPDGERVRSGAPRTSLAEVAREISLSELASLPDDPEARPWKDTSAAGGPGRELPRRGALEVAVEALRNALDSLAPDERAAFAHGDVSGTTSHPTKGAGGQTDAARAEPAASALHSLREQAAHPAGHENNVALAGAVREACLTQRAALLEPLLALDVAAFYDGGGKIRTPLEPVHGARDVAHSLLVLLAGIPSAALTEGSVNGRPGLVASHHGRVVAVIGLDTADRRVVQVWAVLNPDKLRSWNRPPGMASG